MMRKLAAVLIALTILLLTGCGNTAHNSADSATEAAVDLPALSEVMQTIRENTKLPEMMDLTAENLSDYFGIEPQWYTDYAVCINANGYEKDEIVLLRAADEAASDHLADALEQSRKQAADEMQNYLPEQYARIQQSNVCRNGLIVWLFISDQSDVMQSVMDSYFS